MGLPIFKIPGDTNAIIKQGDTIPKIPMSFAVEDDINLTGATIKIQLYLGGILIYNAVSGSGITHIDEKSFEVDKIQQTNPFPVGVLKGDLQITNSDGDTTTYFDIELTILAQKTI